MKKSRPHYANGVQEAGNMSAHCDAWQKAFDCTTEHGVMQNSLKLSSLYMYKRCTVISAVTKHGGSLLVT